MPPVPCRGVPLRMPAGVNVTPWGKLPVREKLGAGVPVAVTVNVLGELAKKSALFLLVITGALVVDGRDTMQS